MTIDVFGIAGSVTGIVNAQFVAQIMYSNGSTTNADYSKTPAYSTVNVNIEVQALSSDDLKQVETIGQQGDMRAVYIYGALNALNRPLQIGGDMLVFYGSKWLVTQQLEEWGNGEWSKVVVTRQIDA